MGISRKVFRILLEGIRSSLRQVVPQAGAGALDTLAEAVAAGNLGAARTTGVGVLAAREALVHGFGWVMLYAAAGA